MARNNARKTAAAVASINAIAAEMTDIDIDAIVASVDTSILDVPAQSNESIDALLAAIDDAVSAPAGWSEIEADDAYEGRVSSDAELDMIVATLDAKDIAAQSQAPTLDINEPAVQQDQAIEGDAIEELPAFSDVLAAIETPERIQMRDCIVRSLDAREAYERDEKANDNILKTLRKSRERLANERIAAVFLATSVDPFEFNRHKVSSNRYNVYAIDKVRDLMEALASGELMGNAINRAITRSLFRFRAAGEQFTGDMARAAASDKIRVSAAISKHLVRHTVSASTAPTQASSTMQALETLGVVKNTGTQKSAVYVLTDTPQTQRLAEIVAKAA